MLLPLISKHELLLREIIEDHFSSSSSIHEDLDRLERQELVNHLDLQIAYLSDMDRVVSTDIDSDVNSRAKDRSGRAQPPVQ